jgi:hypothetical protein
MKCLFGWVLIILSPGLLNAQVVNEKDSLEYNSLMMSIDYFTNTNIPTNINPEIRQPSLSPAVAYISKHGFDALVAGNFTNNSNDSSKKSSSEFDFMLGYNIYILKNLDIYPSYSRFVYSNNTNVFNTIFRNDFRIDAIYTAEKFGLNLSAGFLSGRQRTFYSGLSGNGLFTFEKFLIQGTWAVQPGIDLNFGSYEYLNLAYLDEIRQDPGFYDYLLDNSPVLRRYILKEVLRNPATTAKQIIDRLLEERAEDGFKATSVSVGFPVYYMFKNFGFNLSFYVFLPLNQPDYMSGKALFYFNAGISYNFDFD